MELIQTLDSGFSTAPNGTAQVFARGTTTPVEYFNDFEGLSPVTAGTTINLDAQGAAEVYVNQLVSLLVTDANGTTVADNVPGDAAPLTEVRSNAFLGNAYKSGASAAGNPTTLQAVLDKVLASFGSTDWRVLVDNVPTSLSTAIAGVLGLVFNVKDPTYGALGDSTTDDTSAIAAAITAAAVKGGVVYFPPGASAGAFYKTISTLSLPNNVSILGAGPQVSSIKTTSASTNVFTTTTTPAGTVANNFISNIELGFTGSNTASAIEVATIMPLLVTNCQLGGVLSTPATGLVTITAAASKLTMRDCILEVGNDGTLVASTAAADCHFDRCKFLAPAAARTVPLVAGHGTVSMSDCILDASAVASGTHTIVDLITSAGVTGAKFSDNTFIGNSGATVTGISTPTMGDGTGTITEEGSIFTDVDVPLLFATDFSGFPTIDSGCNFGTRDGNNFSTTNTTSLSADLASYGNHFYEYTGAATAVTISGNLGFVGNRLTVTVLNSNNPSAALTVNFSALVFSDADASITVANGAQRSWSFVFQPTSISTGRWRCCGEPNT